eukprot:TRINITY_DN2081_c0_g1_i1.p1 TRINITY_DN2081_c0_g1~~TRINITY_DN2081_c0_g1_i1.p1  ORF type:complete len:246 (-),score=59.31 TRINITY_DN2081_c0_g1_i1:58-693(-)
MCIRDRYMGDNMQSKLYKILTVRSKQLHQRAEEELIFPLKSRTVDQISKMIDTLKYHKGPYSRRGLAIAAPQMGVMKRLFIIGNYRAQKLSSLYSKLEIIINPTIIELSDETATAFEGCLSIPKQKAEVIRPKKVVVSYYDINGTFHKKELSDMGARIFQHEYDHLEGITMLEKAQKLEENELYKEFIKKKRKQRMLEKSNIENPEVQQQT